MATKEKASKKAKEKKTIEDDIRFLILHNDDHNTFDFVIESLVEICDHDSVQAEQCALITHYKGKCDVKKGHKDELNTMKNKLISKGLSVTLD